MKFAIGQLMFDIQITNYPWGARSVSIKVNGTIAGNKVGGEINMSENNRPLEVNIYVQKEESNEKESP